MRIPHRRGVSRKSSRSQPRKKSQSKEGTGEIGESMANTIVASASATKEEFESLSPLLNGATTRASTADVQATAPLNTATTVSRALASNGQLGSSVTSMTSSISSSKGSSIIANRSIIGSEKGDRSTPSLASAAMSTRRETVTVVVPATSLVSAVHPIQVNTFPSDFPVETQTTALVASAGRGYVFLPNDAFADSMLLFITFFFSFLILTIFAIKLDKCLNRRRGGGKKDQVIREEMRWAEGREILERKIIWQGKMGGEGNERREMRGSGLKIQT
nr:hypothetical protein I308_04806 [Cryptococcus tetragattii IND107]